MKTVDYSNSADCVLEITHIPTEETFLLNALDEGGVSDWISENIGEQGSKLTGCPIYMELSGWAYINAGADGLTYSLEQFDGIDPAEWNITLWNRE